MTVALLLSDGQLGLELPGHPAEAVEQWMDLERDDEILQKRMNHVITPSDAGNELTHPRNRVYIRVLIRRIIRGELIDVHFSDRVIEVI